MVTSHHSTQSTARDFATLVILILNLLGIVWSAAKKDSNLDQVQKDVAATKVLVGTVDDKMDALKLDLAPRVKVLEMRVDVLQPRVTP